MLDLKDFSFFETQNNFDFKGFLIKLTSYWKWFLLCWIIGLFIAYQINIRKEKIYAINSVISTKEESNPLFNSNTSLVFNWGGSSDQVQTITTTLKSRTHNEIVVDKLDFYIDYLKQAKYNIIDAYGEVPFYVKIDKKHSQLAHRNIKVKFLSNSTYEIEIPFEEEVASLINYFEESYSTINVSKSTFKKSFKVGEKIDLPFLKWQLEINDRPGQYIGREYYVKFNNFNSTVQRYRAISVESDMNRSSILRLALQGNNKAKMVKYLNTTVEVLKDKQLAAKNQYANNTIAFIDTTMSNMEKELKISGDELNNFRKDKNIYDVEGGGGIKYTEKLYSYDIQRDEINRKISYYNSLKNYLHNSVDYSKLPAPSVAGIEDPNVVNNVSNLISMSVERSQMTYNVKSNKLFKDFDSQMDAVKEVLLANIASAQAALQIDISKINQRIGETEGMIRKLPEQEQELTKIKRKYNLSDNIYATFLAKRTEAEILKAANISDIKFIDTAKDIGGGLIGPKTGVNYIIALFMGFIIPFLIILILFLLNNSIQNTEDISKLTGLPLIGIVGKKTIKGDLAVYEKPKSALAESFRAIRSSLQFLYKTKKTDQSKIIMVTSSISGEGKTFNSINIATVYALSEKRTILVGVDLRKPRIFGDFDFKNDVGVVNYLIGQKSLEEITHTSGIPYLDVISSGPIPPNPSELIMGENMNNLLNELKQKYDYIILDTPPLGLVTDALEIAENTDVILYIVRQNYTKKEMIKSLNNRVKRGELKNVSLILNDFENKAKYGYGYGYGYGTNNGYGYYSDDSNTNDKKGIFHKIKNIFKKQ